MKILTAGVELHCTVPVWDLTLMENRGYIQSVDMSNWCPNITYITVATLNRILHNMNNPSMTNAGCKSLAMDVIAQGLALRLNTKLVELYQEEGVINQQHVHHDEPLFNLGELYMAIVDDPENGTCCVIGGRDELGTYNLLIEQGFGGSEGEE